MKDLLKWMMIILGSYLEDTNWLDANFYHCENDVIGVFFTKKKQYWHSPDMDFMAFSTDSLCFIFSVLFLNNKKAFSFFIAKAEQEDIAIFFFEVWNLKFKFNYSSLKYSTVNFL